MKKDFDEISEIEEISSMRKHKLVHENYIKVGQPITHDEPTASYFREDYLNKMFYGQVYDKKRDSKTNESRRDGGKIVNLFNIHDTTYNIKHNFMKNIKFYFQSKDKTGKEILYLMNNNNTWSTIHVDEKSSEDIQQSNSNEKPEVKTQELVEFEEFKKIVEMGYLAIVKYIQTKMPIPIALQIIIKIDYINSDDAPQYMKDLMNYIRNKKMNESITLLEKLRDGTIMRATSGFFPSPSNDDVPAFTTYIQKFFKDNIIKYKGSLWENLPLYLKTLLKKEKYELIKELFYGKIKTYKELDEDIDCPEDEKIDIVLLRYLQLIIGRDEYYLFRIIKPLYNLVSSNPDINNSLNTYSDKPQCKEIIDKLLRLCKEKLTYEENQNIEEIIKIIKIIFEAIINMCEGPNKDDFLAKYEGIMKKIDEINASSKYISIKDFITFFSENEYISFLND